MKVWVVTFEDPYGCGDEEHCCGNHPEMEGVFSSEIRAERYVKGRIKWYQDIVQDKRERNPYEDAFTIDDYEIDEGVKTYNSKPHQKPN